MPDSASQPSVSGAGPSGEEETTGRLPGKNPQLLPTPSLTSAEFEDFTERLLSAHRFCLSTVRHVIRVERWGRPGDKQDGIDFEGGFNDGTSASWQCKRYDKLTPGDVRAAVEACTFSADVHHLVYSGEASSPVREEIAQFPNWRLLDQRGLGRLVDDLPLHKRRDVLDATWGVQKRKLLLQVPWEDAFVSLDTFTADRVEPDTILNDLGPHVGRQAELQALSAALDRDGDWPPVVIVTGPGGRGKTRLLVEALAEFRHRNRHIPILWLSPGRAVDASALAELPHTPAVIVIDDAHQDPAAIAPLLQYVRNVGGTQLVLSSRPSGAPALRVQIAHARYPLSQAETVEVRELSRRQARTLVTFLTEGLGLPLAAREYFAGQAVDSPHVAVIASNLIRRGELRAPVTVDPGLREQVLARYEELAASEVDGIPRATVRRLLASYGALGPVEDTDLWADLADFCGLRLVELLRLRRGLHDRGVLVTRSGLTRVVPDVLADDILDGEAAVDALATGFVEELWEVFGGAHGERLFLSLAELDWRLTRRDGPPVIGPVWATVRARLHDVDYDGLYLALGQQLTGLAATQPDLLVQGLEEIRARLEREEVARVRNGSLPEAKGAAVTTAGLFTVSPSTESPSAVRLRFGLKPVGACDIRQLMAPLYGQCAVTAPELLETVLDALWALRRSDARPPLQHLDHPEQVLADRLADLGELPDPSFPIRLVARVEQWLTEPPHEGDVRTPLFALEPLLEKEGWHTVPETRRRLAFRPFAISPERARPVRDAVRQTLRAQATGADLRRAGAAVALLGVALRRPTGVFGRPVPDEEVLAWEEDDLATLAVLGDAADKCTTPVIRSVIRRVVELTAEYALSLRLRHAALTLLTALDERGDDLIELLMYGPGIGMPSRRGTPVPTPEELEQAEKARAEEDTALTTEQLETVRSARVQQILMCRDRAQDELIKRVVIESILPLAPTQIVELLDRRCREIRAAAPGAGTSVRTLWKELGLLRPELASGIVQQVAAGPAGPLDEGLDLLLGVWAGHDETALHRWLTAMSEQRPEVRREIATAFISHGWAERRDAFADVHGAGVQDADPAVRDQFIRASHPLLAARPGSTVVGLLAGAISTAAATDVLRLACRYDGATWGQGLAARDAAAVLRLIDNADWADYVVQQIGSGIAEANPRLVLDHLIAVHSSGRPLPTEVAGFAVAFDHRAEELMEWLVDQTTQGRGAAVNADAVLGLVIAGGLTPRQSEALHLAVDHLGSPQLVSVAAALRGVDTWPQQRPELARHLIESARMFGSDTSGQVRMEIWTAMRVDQWSSTDGVSDDLEAAREITAACALAETDPDLKEGFERALAHIEGSITWLRLEHEEDDE